MISTFGFLVLFEHGPDNYLKNAQADFKMYKEMLAAKPVPKKDQSHKIGM